jgi:hypothetical protein
MLRLEEFPCMDEWWRGFGERNQFVYSLEAAATADLEVPLTTLANDIRRQSVCVPRSAAVDYYVRLTWAFSHEAALVAARESRRAP